MKEEEFEKFIGADLFAYMANENGVLGIVGAQVAPNQMMSMTFLEEKNMELFRPMVEDIARHLPNAKIVKVKFKLEELVEVVE